MRKKSSEGVCENIRSDFEQREKGKKMLSI
jgi:hypothetical protein